MSSFAMEIFAGLMKNKALDYKKNNVIQIVNSENKKCSANIK